MREPNFDNLRRVLNREKPERPTLFEFFLNGELYTKLAGYQKPETGRVEEFQWLAKAFEAAGYDYVTLTSPPGFQFGYVAQHDNKKTISLNEYHSI